MVQRINHAFRNFATKVGQLSKESGHEVQFEVPYQELQFKGVPQKSNVNIMPTMSCEGMIIL
jgi:nucleosome binding factor SPN SPT16 subunit